MKLFNQFRRKIFGTGFGKYLMYAVGEIILVVIGILLAISINNYYQKKSVAKKTKEITQQIFDQMISDSLRVHSYVNYLEKLDTAIAYYRYTREERIGIKNPLKEVTKLNLFIDRDKKLLNLSNLVSTQIEGFDFSSTNYSQLLYNIQTDYLNEFQSIKNQEDIIIDKNNAFDDSLTKYEWYIKFNAERNCANDCINFINYSKEFNTHLAIYKYEKAFIYKLRIQGFQVKLRQNILDLKEILQ